jgi:rRNA maturation RNase YbeY
MNFPGVNDLEAKAEIISFLQEDVDFGFSHSDQVRAWLQTIVRHEGKKLVALTFIFCTDDYLLSLNQEYLDHDTLTDVITFPYSQPPQVKGDIFISIDRIRENATIYQTTFENELHRVMVHGVLHLCGYSDKTDAEAQLMRESENRALSLLEL